MSQRLPAPEEVEEPPPPSSTAAAPEAVQPAPPPSPPPARSSNLALRLAAAAVMIPSVLYLIWIGGLPYLAAVIVIILAGLREFYRLIEDKGAHPLVGYGLAGGAALPIVAWLGNEYHATILMTAVLLGVMVAQLRKAEIGEALSSISGTFFGVFYVGWLMTHAVVLRQFDRVAAAKWGERALAEWPPDVGAFFMMFTLAAVVGCDAGAYFAGRAYGRRKLAPRISPGKTVEGALGGVLGGIFVAIVMKGIFELFLPDLARTLSWGLALLFGLALAVVAIIGDLVESLLKRDAHVKDTGTLIPGTGGVLDRIDSSLLGIPVMYYMLLATAYLRMS